MMEVVAGGERPGAPFTRRNVQEWSKLDRLTGLLEHARVETDHWTASTSSSSHHFGKVVDSRSRNLADGGQEQRQQTKQLEVFQAHIPGGSVQVIRSSTSSSWQTHKVHSGGSGWSGSEKFTLPSSKDKDFDHIKLALKPLDLSSQKTKASIGRSGSIGSRRPPSRPRSIAGVKPEDVSEQTDSRELTELSSICRKVHENAKNSHDRPYDLSSSSCNGNQIDHVTNDKSQSVEAKFKLRNKLNSEETQSTLDSITSNSHFSLVRQKSCSSEDLHVRDESLHEADSANSDWRRSSKVRRSLQFPPKPSTSSKESIVIPVTKSVAEIKRDIEARKQLVTNSFKVKQWNNIAELEGVLGITTNGNYNDESLKENSNSSEVSASGSPTKSLTKKRQTFITVESLKEVRGRLRKLNSPVGEALKSDEVDDGIDSEVKPTSPSVDDPTSSSKSTVKSFVNGMEIMLRNSKQPITGTGSLESRVSNKSSTNGSTRNEEWFNRRKSYGFEQVSNQQNNCSSFERSKMDSSTDSGICRSSDTLPFWSKLSEKKVNNQNTPIKTTHSIIIKPYSEKDTKSDTVEGDTVVHRGRKTVVNLTNDITDSTRAWNLENSELSNLDDGIIASFGKGKIANTTHSLCEESTSESQRLSEPITISIPIQQTTKPNDTDPTNLLLKQTKPIGFNNNVNLFSDRSQITPYSELLFGTDVDGSPTENKFEYDSIPWRGNRTKALSNFFDLECKRHSIAVDQAKYLTKKQSFESHYFNGVQGNSAKESDQNFNRVMEVVYKDQEAARSNSESDHELSSNEKRHKKVEFCKTEVHFAAEPGRFNIVETDGKPPPSNIYRRRRKTTIDSPNKNGLPEIRFGDTQYEKNLLSSIESSTREDNLSRKSFRNSPIFHNERDDCELNTPSNTIVLTGQPIKPSPIKEVSNYMEEKNNINKQVKDDDDTLKPRSILKNNIPKPKPYLLGEHPESSFLEDTSSWGVKLKSVKPVDDSSKWTSDSKDTDFKTLLKTLRPAPHKPSDMFDSPMKVDQFSTAADNGLEVRITSSYLPDNRRASWSVADRIRHVEEARGYSTKVNFGPQETTVVKSENLPSCFNYSGSVTNNWNIKEQSPSFDTRSAEPPSRVGTGRSLSHSRSFNITPNRVGVGTNNDSETVNRNVLKSTSLVMEVQSPHFGQNSECERKISVKDNSTNLMRDNCERNVNSVRGDGLKKDNTQFVNDKEQNYRHEHQFVRENKTILIQSNTNTVPQVRKTSSATQTYFVNRSSVRKDQHSKTHIKINLNKSDTDKSSESINDMAGIPGVLNELDDLSRCIDEVIIESPQRVCKKDIADNTHVFKLREDCHRESNSPQTISNVSSNQGPVLSQLDMLREIVDSGELSEDSLKADEEVRAYMSTDIDDDTLSSERSGSWSRVRTLREQTRPEEVKGASTPSCDPGNPLQHKIAADPQPGTPQGTSVTLHYNRPPAATIRPYTTAVDAKLPGATYVSRNLLNSDPSTSVTQANNGDRTFSFSKHKERHQREVTTSPNKSSRNSYSPTKEASLLDRATEKSSAYDEKPSSKTSTSCKTLSSSINVKVESINNSSKKNESNLNLSKYSNQPLKMRSGTSVSRTKLEDKSDSIKRNDGKKATNEVKTRERKLSASSSGRDSWLNTPKEVQARKKPESSLRTKKETKTNERTIKVDRVKTSPKRAESPIYQNREMYAQRQDSNDNTETESTILEELTKAADQILLAVNGYTDDDSFRASSDDEYRKKRDKFTSQPLSTISERPSKTNNSSKCNRQTVGVIKSTRSTDLRKEYHSSSKTRVGKTSSNSSVECGTTQDIKPLLSSEDRSKRRAARLLQRANSRELLFQSAASSSEDMGSGSDTGSLRTKRIIRRPRLQNGRHSGSKQDLNTNSLSESRTKEKVHRNAVSEKSQRPKLQSERRCSKHTSAISGPSSGEVRERRSQAVTTHSARTQRNATETSQSEARKRSNLR